MLKRTELLSEQLPNDGSFYLNQQLKEANEELKKEGKHGCRCMLKRSGNTVSLQFNWHGQKNLGSSESFTKRGIEAAKQKALKVTAALESGSYSEEWFQTKVLGKEKVIQNPEIQEPTFRELFEKFKVHWEKENKDLKSKKKTYYDRIKPIEKAVDDEPITEAAVKKIIESTKPNSRVRTIAIWGLIEFLEYCDRYEPFKKKIESYQKRNKPVKRPKNIPDDRLIVSIYLTG